MVGQFFSNPEVRPKSGTVAKCLLSHSNQGCGAGAQAILDGRSLKFGFPFNRHSLLGKRVLRIIQWFLVFNGPNRPGAGAKNF